MKKKHVKKNDARVNLSFRHQITQVSRTSVSFVLGLFLVFISWGLSSPIGSAADDTFHLPSIWCDADYKNNTGCDLDKNEAKIAEVLIGSTNCYTQWAEIKKEVYKKSARCVNSALSGQTLIETNRINSINALYPKLYYKISSYLVDNNYEKSIILLRIFWTAFFCVNILLLLLFSSLKLVKSVKSTILFAGTPLLLFLIPSTNPSGVVCTALFSIAGWCLNAINTTRIRIQLINILMIVINTVVAIGSRADSFIFLIIIVTGCLFLMDVKNRIRMFCIALYVSLVLVLNFFVFASSEFVNMSTGGLGQSGLSNLSNLDLAVENLWNFHSYIAGFWGYYWGLGWKFEPYMPTIVPVSLTILFFTSFLGTSFSNIPRTKIVTISTLVGVLISIPIYQLQISDAPVGELVQPRYLYPYFLSLALILRYWLKEKNVKSISRKIKTGSIFFSVFTLIIQWFLLVRNVNGLNSLSLELNSSDSWWWTNLPVTPSFLMLLTFIGLSLIHYDSYLDEKRLT